MAGKIGTVYIASRPVCVYIADTPQRRYKYARNKITDYHAA